MKTISKELFPNLHRTLSYIINDNSAQDSPIINDNGDFVVPFNLPFEEFEIKLSNLSKKEMKFIALPIETDGRKNTIKKYIDQRGGSIDGLISRQGELNEDVFQLWLRCKKLNQVDKFLKKFFDII